MANKRLTNKELNASYNSLIEKYETIKKQVENFQSEVDEKIRNSEKKYSEKEQELINFTKTQKAEIAEFENHQKQRIDELFRIIEERKASFDEYYSKLFLDEDNINKTINDLKNDIKRYHNLLFEGDGEEEAIKDKITNIHRQLNNYRKEVFGYIEKDEHGEPKKILGLKDDVENLIDAYEESIKTFETKTEAVIADKTKKMDELLRKMNLNYNNVENEALSKKYFKLSKIKDTAIRNSTILLIIVTVALTVTLFILFTNDTLSTIFNGKNLIAGAIIRIAITTPLIYLIVTTANRLRKELAIRDQYNFKGLIMSTYRNVSTHISNSEMTNKEGKQQELLDKVFNKILENEADKIENNDQFTVKSISKNIGQLAKDLGVSKANLISILPEIIEKLKKQENEDKKSKNTDVLNNTHDQN
jgi:phage antirepressor YoqD-like protein